MIRISFITAAMAAAFSAAVFATATHLHIEGQSCPLHGDSFISAEGITAKKLAQKQLLVQRSTQGVYASATMDNPAVIDVAVLMHTTWIEAMKDKLTQDANGKYYENGAQFAVERIKAQYAYFNESLKLQKVPVVFRPVYFAQTENTLESGVEYLDLANEYATVYNCVMNPKWVEINNGNQELCESQGLFRISDITNGSADVMHYVREVKDGQSTGGLGGFFQGVAIFDAYRGGVGIIKESNAAGENLYTSDDMNSLRFGHVNASTLTHEFGHVFGGMHNVWSGEPADGNDNRAFACGKKDPRRSWDTDKKPTALWANGGWLTDETHRFYSDPDTVVDGDACGVVGEANNLRVVKENAPLVALNKTMRAATSQIQFALDSYSVTRAEGTVSITLKRTGDTSEAAYLSMTAKDGSAWEGRDFDFGFKEVAFAAGESEKTVTLTLLPRAKRHADTELSLQIHGAIGATFPTEGPTINILSDKPLVPGTVQFATESATIIEGNQLQVRINRLNGQDGYIQYTLLATDGTAKAGTDYEFWSGTRTIRDGESETTVEVDTSMIAGKQGRRHLTLNLTAVSDGAILGELTTTRVNIDDATEPGKLNFSSPVASVTEGDSIKLTVQRTDGTEGDLTVQLRTVSGTAASGTDFTSIDQPLTFAAGQSTASVTVNTLKRTGDNGSRFFYAALSRATAGTIGYTNEIVITINDSTATTNPDTGAGDSGGGGGSVGWWMMLVLAVAGLARRVKA
ncbi:Calx-beta domain-containing protein [Rheinheimera marina]|uniref:Calx-beta domain-containing protein n=1 Tax=Rheinheimera marina TaxID=1774958 RepID=A0ABV9JHF6_9GAMM